MTWRPLPVPDQPGHPVGESLERLAKRWGLANVDTITSVTTNWPAAVGKQIAHHSTPISLRDGVLRVNVDDSQWLTQLKWGSNQIVTRLNDAVGKPVVERLELRLE